MLAKKYRLDRHQIELIVKKGRGQSFDLLGIKFIKNNLNFSRFAVVVGKKISNKATERNRLRRIIFDELKENPLVNIDCMIRLYRLPENEKILREKIKEVFSKINV